MVHRARLLASAALARLSFLGGAALATANGCAPPAAVEILDLAATFEQRDPTCGVLAQQCQVVTGTFRVRNVGAAAMTGIVAADASIDDLTLNFEDDVGDSSADRAPCAADPWDVAPGRTSDEVAFRMTTSSGRAVESDPSTYYVALYLPCGDGEAYPTAIERESMLPQTGTLSLDLSGTVDTGDVWTAAASAELQ